MLVGRDNRLSSGRIRDNLVAGLTAAGCWVIDIGTVITPLFYYSRILYNINAGLMITASHNPAEFNGFKVALGPATIYGAEIQNLYKLAVEISTNLDVTITPINTSQVEYRSGRRLFKNAGGEDKTREKGSKWRWTVGTGQPVCLQKVPSPARVRSYSPFCESNEFSPSPP